MAFVTCPVQVSTAAGLSPGRLTVGFRLILVIPHLFWLAGWFYLATLVAIATHSSG